MKNANTLQQKIIDGVALSILSRIPIFLIGNPGISKTSVIRRLAIENGYHCEAISGSHYSPEDVNGFPVNDNNELRLLKPRWLNNILKAKEEGKTSILFVDEITTANEFTQAALLTVIFDRIVGETPLPEDTIIISAGNYYHNLSSSFNMITPTMNRFMILNLRTSNQEIDIENFIKGPEHDTHDYKINKTAEIEYEEVQYKHSRQGAPAYR
jgi:MoxR-like ATPase